MGRAIYELHREEMVYSGPVVLWTEVADRPIEYIDATMVDFGFPRRIVNFQPQYLKS